MAGVPDVTFRFAASDYREALGRTNRGFSFGSGAEEGFGIT